MTTENETKKKEILKHLKKESLSTSKIAHKINWNYWYTLDLLLEMKKEKLIKIASSSKGKFWIINKTKGVKNVNK